MTAPVLVLCYACSCFAFLHAFEGKKRHDILRCSSIVVSVVRVMGTPALHDGFFSTLYDRASEM